MAITASMVKELRELTGAGMMDCKKALEESGGDMQKAVDILRTKGLADLAKRAGRATNEGVIAAWTNDLGRVGAMVEVNCETDFVARNAEFTTFASAIAQQVAIDAPSSVDALPAMQWKRNPSLTIGHALGELVGKLGENIVIKRFVRFDVPENGMVSYYIHGLGRIGVMVEIGGSDHTDPAVVALAKDVAMHIAASQPICVLREDVPVEIVTHETGIYKAQAAASGKPEPIQVKIAEGRLEKFYREVCLVEQPFVKDPDKTVEQLVAETSKAVGKPLRVVRFERLVLGGAADTQS